MESVSLAIRSQGLDIAQHARSLGVFALLAEHVVGLARSHDVADNVFHRGPLSATRKDGHRTCNMQKKETHKDVNQKQCAVQNGAGRTKLQLAAACPTTTQPGKHRSANSKRTNLCKAACCATTDRGGQQTDSILPFQSRKLHMKDKKCITDATV